MAGLTHKDLTDQRKDAMREGVKALFLMNGGGTVACLRSFKLSGRNIQY